MSQNSSDLPRSRHLTFLLTGVLWLLLGLIILVFFLVRPSQIEIVWETATEFQTAGYNILRGEEESGPYEKINERLIPSNPDAAAGATYKFVDENVQRGKTYYYQLEDVDFDNSTGLHEVLSGKASSMPVWSIGLVTVCTLIGLGLLVTGTKTRTIG